MTSSATSQASLLLSGWLLSDDRNDGSSSTSSIKLKIDQRVGASLVESEFD